MTARRFQRESPPLTSPILLHPFLQKRDDRAMLPEELPAGRTPPVREGRRVLGKLVEDVPAICGGAYLRPQTTTLQGF